MVWRTVDLLALSNDALAEVLTSRTAALSVKRWRVRVRPRGALLALPAARPIVR